MFSIIYYTAVLITRRIRRRTSVARDRMIVSNRESSSSPTHILESSVSGQFPHQIFFVEFYTLLIFFESRCLSMVFFFIFSFVFLSTHAEENLIIKIWKGWIVCVCTLWSDTCVSGEQLQTTIQSFVCFPIPHNPAWSLQCVFHYCLFSNLSWYHLHCDFERCST